MRLVTLPIVLLLLLVVSGPAWSADAEPRIERVLVELEDVATRLALQKEGAPEDRRGAIRESFSYSVNKHAERLARETDASTGRIEAFREDAKAIGREHGLVD